MKTGKKTLFFLFMIGIAFINSTCKQDLFKKITFEGHVYHCGTSNPISGVTIELKACAAASGDALACGCNNNLFNVGTTSTDASGYFKITKNAASTNSYHLVIDGMGYNLCGYSESELKTNCSNLCK